MLKLAELKKIEPRSSSLRPSELASGTSQSALRELIGMANAPGVLSFSVGLPAGELFPLVALRTAAERVLSREPAALQYGLPSAVLKAHVVQLMKRRGVACDVEQVFLTAGSQQGMVLLAQLLLEPSGQVMLEDTVYDGIRMALRPFRPLVLPLATSSQHGVDVDQVENLLEAGARPAFVYLIPEGHNPTGSRLSLEKRLRLIELARSFGVPLLEDDAYGMLTYDEAAPPPLAALDSSWVFYLGSFSKILAPGFRVGWIVAPREQMPRLAALKHAADIDTCSVSQHTVASYLDTGALGPHIELLRKQYQTRRDATLSALAQHMPAGTSWEQPASGFFVWVKLPRGLDAARLLRAAIEQEKMAFSPGIAFSAPGVSDHCLRLSFANLTPLNIDEGITRLGRVIASFL